MAKKIDKELVIEALIKKFGQYDFITPSYLDELVSGFYKESFVFEGIPIEVDGYQVANSSYYYVLGLCQNILNSILCKKAQNDEEILLELMVSLTRTTNFVCRKLQKPLNDPVYDEYLQECISTYDLSLGQTLDQYVTKYFMKVFNTRYVVERKETNFVYRESYRKNKEVESIEIEEPKKEVIETKEEMIEEITDESGIEVITVEELINNNNQVEVVPVKTPMEFCLEKTQDIVGSASYDMIISLYKHLGMKDKIPESENDLYNVYILLRFGFIRESYYSLEEIAYLCQVSIDEIHSYEKYTLDLIMKTFNKEIDAMILKLK